MPTPPWTWQARRLTQGVGLAIGTYRGAPPHPAAPFTLTQQGRRLDLRVYGIAHGYGLRLTVPPRVPLATAARLAGAALADQHPPLILLLPLALLAQTGRLPSPDQQRALLEVVDRLRTAPGPADRAATLPGAVLTATAGHTLTGPTEGLQIPAGGWNAARYYVALGQAAWHLAGPTARRWATVDRAGAAPGPAAGLRILLAQLAAFVGVPSAPLPGGYHPAPATAGATVWRDWVVLATALQPPPPDFLPAGLGDRVACPPRPPAPTLSPAGNARLEAVAATLRAGGDRPAPRHLAQITTLRLPALLWPLWAWGMTTLRIYPLVTGLFWALEGTGPGTPLGWWTPADPPTACPLTMPLSLWPLFDATLAACWADLTTADWPRALRGRETSPTDWISPATAAALASLRALGATYRRLPAGWEARQADPAFQRRVAAAAARAAAHPSVAGPPVAHPAPPPGWTFVAAHQRRTRAAGAAATATVAQMPATGLRLLALVLDPAPAESALPIPFPAGDS